jgi:hypothetical protein
MVLHVPLAPMLVLTYAVQDPVLSASEDAAYGYFFSLDYTVGSLKTQIVTYISSVFRYFEYMLQVFRMSVVKVYYNVAYVTIVVHVCYERLFPTFHLFFQTYVVSVFI